MGPVGDFLEGFVFYLCCVFLGRVCYILFFGKLVMF